MRTCVYRAYDESGRLLYVGTSPDWSRRWVAHSPELVAQTAQLCVKWFETKAEAQASEAELVRSLRPPFNAVPQPNGPVGVEYGAFGRRARLRANVPLTPAPPEVSRAPAYTIREIAARLELKSKTLRNVLSDYRSTFSANYTEGPNGSRVRLLSEADLHLVCQIVAASPGLSREN
jgi:hypothetical protein